MSATSNPAEIAVDLFGRESAYKWAIPQLILSAIHRIMRRQPGKPFRKHWMEVNSEDF